MKDNLALVGIILAGIITGCAWHEKNGPWLGVKTSGKKESAPVPPKHESVLGPEDGLFVTEPETKPATASGPVIRPIAETRPGPAIRPVVETRPQLVAETAPVTPTTAAATEPAGGEVVAASIVQVNDRFITIEDVLKSIAADLARLPVTVSETTYRRKVVGMIDEEVRRQVIQMLVLAEAKRRLTDQQKEHIDKDMEEILGEMTAQATGSRQKLEARFIHEGTTLKAAMARQRKQLTMRLYLRARFMPTISVTGNMLWRYYNSHRADFTTPKKVQMQIIAANVKAFLLDKTSRPTEMELKAARKKAKQVIDKAVKQLVDGQPFGEVAKRLSRGIKAANGGLWDLMPKGSFKAERVEQVAFKLTEGQIAGPIEIDSGYYIVKAKKVQPGKEISYEDAQEDIEKALREQQFNKATEEYYKKVLKASTIVQAKDFLRMATDQAVEKYWPK
ncbi:MAG: peptidyl-prolyl cis-trans isomerase [Phycisphaerae bacterium]|nr:peptidyl-prolyl cis-trans isomerase [Phycisphaerae bacterium]